MCGRPPRLSAERAVPSAVSATEGLKRRMPNFTKLTTESELPPADEAKEFPCGAKNYLRRQRERHLQRHGQRLPASRRPAGAGNDRRRQGGLPWHGWAWDPKTGAAEQNPGHENCVVSAEDRKRRRAGSRSSRSDRLSANGQFTSYRDRFSCRLGLLDRVFLSLRPEAPDVMVTPICPRATYARSGLRAVVFPLSVRLTSGTLAVEAARSVGAWEHKRKSLAAPPRSLPFCRGRIIPVGPGAITMDSQRIACRRMSWGGVRLMCRATFAGMAHSDSEAAR